MGYKHIVFHMDGTLLYTEAEGVKKLLERLKEAGYELGVVTSKTRETYQRELLALGMSDFFETAVCGDDTGGHRGDGEALGTYIRNCGIEKEDVLYIGDSMSHMAGAMEAKVDGGLALWGCPSAKHIRAACYFPQPYDVYNYLTRIQDPMKEKRWLSWAMELQFIAQAGITYSKDAFDVERFERIRELSAQLMEQGTGLEIEKIQDVFCNETGFQTPKLDTRAAVFCEDKILLVQEKDGTWSLPGGWVDVNRSVADNVVKEVKEEAGLLVVPDRLIALHDRNRHNVPLYAYGICKVFMLCKLVDGAFEENLETVESRYFGKDEIPALALEKNTPEQIQMCFDAYENPQWKPVTD